MPNVISREGRNLGKQFSSFVVSAVLTYRNCCQFLVMCECVCVCEGGVFGWSRNLQNKEIFQELGTFLHLTPSEISGKHMELSRGWPCTIVLAWYSQSLPCCFPQSPWEKSRPKQEAQPCGGLLLQEPWCLLRWCEDRFSGEQTLVYWEWPCALQRLWSEETAGVPTVLRYLDGIRSPED